MRAAESAASRARLSAASARPAAWSAAGGAEAQLVVVAPRLAGGWALLGEEAKLVPVSAVRFTALAPRPAAAPGRAPGLQVDILGPPGERVGVLTATPESHVLRVACTLPGSGRARAVFAADGSAACA